MSGFIEALKRLFDGKMIGAALIALAISYFFYWQSGKELEVQAACLRRLHLATIDSLNNIRGLSDQTVKVAILPDDKCGHSVTVTVPGPPAVSATGPHGAATGGQ